VLCFTSEGEEMWVFYSSCFRKESTSSSSLFLAFHGGLMIIGSNWLAKLQEDVKFLLFEGGRINKESKT
jgi:phage replication-related protein YjqB (UPF0714/DUF867 family)